MSEAIIFLFLIISTIYLSTCCFQLCYCNIQNNYTVCPEIEKEALLSFKKSVSDDANLLSSWKEQTNCCMWEGVVCNNLTGHVLQLHLQNRFYVSGLHGLQGKLNPCLLNLKHLRYVDLSLNEFTEHIPNFIGSFTNLEYLDLTYAELYGPIPHTLGNLTSLRTLKLGGITSNVDSSNIEWLSSLSHLEHLEIYRVNLSRATNSLQVLNNLPSLVELHLRHCNLESNNFQLAPHLDEVNFTSLAILDLSENKLGPIVPRWISHLNKLTYLNLVNNLFEGSIPTISNTTKLQYISLSYNNFNSTIPDWICTCKSLQFLGLSGNLLAGPIPINLGNLSSMTQLRLDFNKLTGNLPYSFGQLNNLKYFMIENNMLEGIVSKSHFDNLTNLSVLIASENHLTLEVEPNWIPPFKLVALGLGSWNLGGDRNQIPTWLETQKGSVRNLDLSNTGISFHVLSWFWEIPSYLNLSRNFIESASIATNGTEPQYDVTLYLFTSIDLSRNHLSGEIPKQITSLVGLRSLNLSENHFTGHIPDGIGDMKQLESLDISRNSLSGEIPKSISVLTSLSYMDLSYNNLTGRIPESAQLGSLTASGFIGNKLCGPPLTSGCSNDKDADEVHAPGFYYHKEDRGKRWEIDWFYIFLTLGYVVGFSAVCNALIFIKSWRDAYFGWIENMWNKLCVYTSRRRC